MRKRITALLVCLIMLMAVPIQGFASEVDSSTAAAPTQIKYVSSGDITYGTIAMYDPDGNQLLLKYAYSPSVTMSSSIASELCEMLADADFFLPAMHYNYQLMNTQSFFVVQVTDGYELAKFIDAMVKRAGNADADAVSPSDAVSATDVSSTDVSSSDAAASDSDVDASETALTNISTSLHSLLFGSASFKACATLEESLEKAFPEFEFNQPEPSALPQELNLISGVALSSDRTVAQVAVLPEPEYVEREVFGETFQVLMVSSVAYSYDVISCNVVGAVDGADIPEDNSQPTVSESDAADATTTTTTATTTTTTTAATTTTTASEQTTESEPAATATTTTAPQEEYEEGYPREGVVSTTWRRLNVRSGPGLNYKVIDRLNIGTKVTVLAHEDGWYRVQLANGAEGWCTDEYITLK